MISTHPTPEQLTAYALGKVSDDAQATEIADHLEECEDCQQAVVAAPDDSLLAAIRPMFVPGHEPRLTTDPWVPTELADHPRYRLVKWIGAGGMGVVLKAEHRLMDRSVALKVINRSLTGNPAASERFRREVKAAARLDHPNIVRAYDAEQVGDLHFLVMEFIEGIDLARFVQEKGPLPVLQACDFARQAALGLQHAFERGLVHRDIKPSNLMLTATGQVKILDFGLAGFFAEEESHTEFGIALGTPSFMAPEQGRDAASADVRADIYSLGCTLYFLLSGRAPFLGGSLAQKLSAHQQERPRPLSELRQEVPEALSRIVDKILAKDPVERYQTPAEVADALAPFAGVSKPRRWPSLIVGVAGVAALVMVVPTFFPVSADKKKQDEGPTENLEPPIKTARELYREALAAEARSDTTTALRSLTQYFQVENDDYFDPFQMYRKLLKVDSSDLEIEGKLKLLFQEKPTSKPARLIGIVEDKNSLRSFIKECPDYLPAYPALAKLMPTSTVLEDIDLSRLRVEFQQHGGFTKLQSFYLSPNEAESHREFGLNAPLDPSRYFEARCSYDQDFKGLEVDFRDKRVGKELLLKFANGAEARGPLQPHQIGDEEKFAMGKAIFELSRHGKEFKFEKRRANDPRIFKHCGYLQGAKPGQLKFDVTYTDAKGQSCTFSAEATVPAFMAEVVQGRTGKPILRVVPFERMVTCQIASSKDGKYVAVPQHMNVPTMNEIELAKAPGYEGKAGLMEFWIKGKTGSGESVEPEAVKVLCPGGE